MLILIVGPSGAGKDTLMNGARERLGDDARYRFVRRTITRPGQIGEEAHDSAGEQDFELRREGGEFALTWRAHGLRYGVPADIAVDLAGGRVVIANVSRAVVAEVSAPADVLARRLAARGREDAVDVARRLSRAIELPMPVDRHSVVNDGTVEQGVRRLLTAISRATGDAPPA